MYSLHMSIHNNRISLSVTRLRGAVEYLIQTDSCKQSIICCIQCHQCLHVRSFVMGILLKRFSGFCPRLSVRPMANFKHPRLSFQELDLE